MAEREERVRKGRRRETKKGRKTGRKKERKKERTGGEQKGEEKESLPGPWGGRLGAHRVSSRPRRQRCSLSWTAESAKSSGRPVAFKGATQHNEGANPKTGKANRPFNKRTSRRGMFREGSCAGVTSGTTDHTCTTATALQLHCTSVGLRGRSRFCVCGLSGCGKCG